MARSARPFRDLAALVLLAACSPDAPDRDPSDAPPEEEDTAPPEPAPPRPVHATFAARVAWDDEAGDVRDTVVDGSAQPPGVVLELWSQDADLDDPRPEHLCQLMILADYTASPPPDESPHRLVLDGAVLGGMRHGCDDWDLSAVGGDDPSWVASLRWQLALGGPVHDEAGLPPGGETSAIGVTLSLDGIVPETHALVAVAARVDASFEVLLGEEGEFLMMDRDEMLDAKVFANGLYMIATPRPIDLGAP